MKRRKLCLLSAALAAVLLCCTGCAPSRELKDMGIVEGMGVDLEKDGQYLVTYQIFQSQSEGGEEKVKVQQATGATLFDAGRNMTQQTGKRLYYANQSAFVIGSDLARKGISPIVDFFARNHELRTGQRIFMAEGRAADILTTQGDDGIIPVSTLELASQNEQYTGKILDIQGIEMFERISTQTDAVILPVVIYQKGSAESDSGSSQSTSEGSGSTPGNSQAEGGGTASGSSSSESSQNPQAQGILKVERTAVFNTGLRLAGFLNGEQTRGYNWTSSGRVQGALVLTLPDKSKVSIEIRNNSCSMEVAQNAFTFHIAVEALITEQENIVQNPFDTAYRSRLIKLIQAQVKNDVNSAVDAAFYGMQSDIFRIGSHYFRMRPAQWRTLSKNWPAAGKKLKCNVEVQVSLRSSG